MEQQKKIFIEKIGVKTEKMGYSPLAGRIIGTLLLAEPPYKTFDDLCAYLSASKSSISNNLSFLEKDGVGLVEYFTIPGDRKRYFKISMQNWFKHLRDIPAEFQNSNELLKEIVEYRKEFNLDSEMTDNLQVILSFYEFVVKKLPDLIQEWEQNVNCKISK